MTTRNLRFDAARQGGCRYTVAERQALYSFCSVTTRDSVPVPHTIKGVKGRRISWR
jgi:hypothetical protein